MLIYRKNDKEIDCRVYYYIDNDRIVYEEYNDSDVNIKFKYFIDQKSLKCEIGNCKNYQSEIDYILAEYQQILEIL